MGSFVRTAHGDAHARWFDPAYWAELAERVRREAGYSEQRAARLDEAKRRAAERRAMRDAGVRSPALAGVA
jgi:hypothetical protein